MTKAVEPLDVDCHSCHAGMGESCRWGPMGERPCPPGYFHPMREIRAEEIDKKLRSGEIDRSQGEAYGFRVNPGPDERRRRLERAASAGDVGAASQLLLQIARQGTWFLPPGWRGPGGFPYGTSLNRKRAFWVRTLGFLRWPDARQFQNELATQGHAPPVAIDVLAGAPFTRIGPETAHEIGLEVMLPMAEAAAREAFSVSDLDPVFWNNGIKDLHAWWREIKRFRTAYDRGDHDAREASLARARQLETALWNFGSQVRLLWGRDIGPRHYSEDYTPFLSVYHSREALDDFFTSAGRHQSDAVRQLGEAVFHATYALAFACDVERGVEVSRGSRPRVGWGDRFGFRPSRGCMTIANRRLKKAMLEPAILSIAGEMTRY